MKENLTQRVAWLALTLSILTFGGVLYLAAPIAFSAANPQDNANTALQQPNGAAAIGQSFNYQGILRDANGKLLTGVYTLTLKIYDAAIGGAPLFTQSAPNINVRDGVFNVVLGNTPGNPIDVTTFANSPRYLGITIAPQAELIPRQEIHAVPWALIASQASSANWATRAERSLGLSAPDDSPVNAVLVDNEGHVVIGGTNPASELDLYGRLSINGQRTIAEKDNSISVGDIDGGDGYRALELRAGDQTRIYVSTDGQVGIGKTNPQATLDISGSIDVKGFPLVRIIRFENVGNGATFDTGVSADQYHCVATGWSSLYEVDAVGAEVDALWTFVSGSTWRFRVNFASGNDSENPDVDVLCFRQEIASWEGAARTLNQPD